MNFIFCLISCCLPIGSFAHLEDGVASCPPLPDYRQYLPQLPDLGRRLRICCPCVGIDGAGHALQTMGCGSSMHNVYDLVHDYREALTSHFQEMGMEVIRLNLGKKSRGYLECTFGSIGEAY